jgi:hypothetical protein
MGPTALAQSLSHSAPVGYDVLLVLHILSALMAIVAFALSGGYALLLDHAEPTSRVAARRYFAAGPNRVAFFALFGVPVSGVVLFVVHHGQRFTGGLWLPAGAGLWALAAIVALEVVRPAEAEISSVIRGTGSDDNERPEGAADPAAAKGLSMMRRATWRLSIGAAAISLLVIVVAPLMILKP